MKAKTIIFQVIVFVLAVIAIAGMICLYDQSSYAQKNRIASLLNIDTAPATLADAHCVDWGTSDLLVACYATIASTDLPQLLQGYAFVERSRQNQSSHDKAITSGPKVGPEFSVVKSYSISPQPFEKDGYKRFKNGGQISVYTNEQSNQLILNYYEE